ncbi:MAG: hypothetical protein NTV21_06005 [Planctomycetota bacterium]|nr:hypothetical protein [Planctomycetota bacterium]
MFQSNGLGSAALTALELISGVFTLAMLTFWMWIGWRAMRAHERIADSLQAPERKS